MRIVLAILALAACDKPDPLFCMKHADQCNDGGPGDHPDTPDATEQLDFGMGAYAVHLESPATGTLTLGSFSTSGGNPCASVQYWADSNQPAACFVVAADIMITNATITGTRPVVFVAANNITITGTLDISSHLVSGALTLGAGVVSPPTGACAGTAPGNDANGGGGGGGGTFGSKGGPGGAGNNGAAAGGIPPATPAAPMYLRPGCSGQTGGTGGTGGLGGGGGGAAYLLAANQIDLSAGGINASGAGGSAGSGKGGGGGGGAGGMVVLYADSIPTSVGTKIYALGGGGAGGAANGGGNAGSDPAFATPPTGGSAGGAPGSCSNTGAGGAGSNSGDGTIGGSGQSTCGGGAGGGGIGYVQANKALGSGTYAPSPVIP